MSPEGVQPPIWCIFLGFNGISGFGFPVNEGFTSNTSVFCCVWPLAWGTWWLTSLTWWFFSGNLNLGGGKVQKSYHQQNEVGKWGKSDKTSVFPWDQFRVYCLVSDIWPSSAWKASHMLVDSSVETAYRGWKLPAILAFQKIPAFRPTANWDGRSTVELVMLQKTPALGNLRYPAKNTY